MANQVIKWLENIHADATHIDVFFLPCSGSFPVLGWAPAAVSHLSAIQFIGRPTVEHVIEYRSNNVIMVCSSSPDIAPRVASVTPLRESTHDMLFARELMVTPTSPHAFPSQRNMDSVRKITRTRWNLHHRVKLHVDTTDDEAIVYMRYNHSNNVDSRALNSILTRGINALTTTLYTPV